MASGIELATAYVQIVPSAEGIEGKIADVLNSEASNAGVSAGKITGKSFGSSLAKAIKSGAVMVGSAVSTLLTSTINNAVDVSAVGDNIDKMSQKIGISAEAYQEWDYVMQRAGTDVDSLKTGMKTLATAVESGSDAFEQLGISQQQLDMMSQEELLEEVIKGLAGMEEGAERTALATKLLGRAGMDLAPLLNEGTDAIEEQIQMAHDYGMIMSNEAVLASAAFQDSLTTFKGTIEGIKNSIFAEFLPSMTSVMDGLSMVFAGNEEGMELVQEGIREFIEKLGDIIPAVLELGGEILVTLAGAIIEHLPDLIDSAVGIINQLVGTIGEHMPELVDAAVQIMMALVSGLITAMPQIVAAMGTMFMYIFDAIRSNLPEMLRQGMEILVNIGLGIARQTGEVVGKIGELIRKMIERLKQSISEFIGMGGEIMNGLAQGIKNGLSAVVNSMKNALSDLVNAGKSALGIQSPSKLFRDVFGKNIMLGMAEGITENADAVTDALNDVSGLAVARVQYRISTDQQDYAAGRSYLGATGGYTQNITINRPRELTPSEIARQTRNATRQMALQMAGVY